MLLAAGAALGVPGDAGASSRFRATFKTTFLSRHHGASTGLRTRIAWSDPGATNGVPKVIKEIQLRFPVGTRLDTSALARCSASDKAIRSLGASACPPSSALGGGSTIGVLPSGGQFTTKVRLFNAKRQIIVIVTLNGVLATEFRDRVGTKTILIRPVLPAGVSLARLALRMGAFSTGSGTARRVYMRTPRTCPASGRWTIVGRLTYADGSRQTLNRNSPCRPPRRPGGHSARRSDRSPAR